MEIKLTETDKIAIENGDYNYINSKGAGYYYKEEYAKAAEYYRLAASMGSTQVVSNLGYCYLYGRDMEADLILALAYFRIASKRGNIDASYKLGDIYGSDKWGMKDKEQSVYYYRLAVDQILDDDWSFVDIMNNDILMRYPSLCFAIGREMGIGGQMNADIDLSYQFLVAAKKGYEIELTNGVRMYEESYKNILKWLEKKGYKEMEDKYEPMLTNEAS